MGFVSWCVLSLLVLGITSQFVAAQEADKSAYVARATSKSVNFPGIPPCMTGAVQSGDPGKGNATLLLKAQTGCMVPWHWHTPTERLMMVSGRAKAEMKGGSPVVLRPGDFLYLAAKHVHQFTCQASCSLFDVTGDAPFDVHYVDANGNEIPPEQALKSAPAAKKKAENAAKQQ
jgi:quercetin dioxygenase-like cupin family protein